MPWRTYWLLVIRRLWFLLGPTAALLTVVGAVTRSFGWPFESLVIVLLIFLGSAQMLVGMEYVSAQPRILNTLTSLRRITDERTGEYREEQTRTFVISADSQFLGGSSVCLTWSRIASMSF